MLIDLSNTGQEGLNKIKTNAFEQISRSELIISNSTIKIAQANIQITEAKATINQAELDINQAKETIKYIDNVFNTSLFAIESKKSKEKNYDPEAGWLEKVKFILRGHNKIMRMSQILEKAIDFGESLKKNTPEFAKARANVAAVLKTYIDRGELVRMKLDPDIPFFYYGLPEWITEGELEDIHDPKLLN